MDRQTKRPRLEGPAGAAAETAGGDTTPPWSGAQPPDGAVAEPLASTATEPEPEPEAVLRAVFPAEVGCRSVDVYERVNRIDEGTYGVVFRCRDKGTGEMYALKKLKMEREKNGFPITSLREINTLLKARHENIVHVREIVVGSDMDQIFIVMEYVEHDLKTLLEDMRQPFRPAEVKTLLQQLIRGVHHLHDNWILHRDLKTSNLLLNHRGILKIADFGLAREYGSPLKKYTSLVVTLWYRAPELLLGAKMYSTAVDMWSVGCIFAEFLTQKALFPGQGDIDQLRRIFQLLGTPNRDNWRGFEELPVVKQVNFTTYPRSSLRKSFRFLSEAGFKLLTDLLYYDPQKRLSAKEALESEYFFESPKPIDPDMFPTWPARSEGGSHKRKAESPPAPAPKGMFADDNEEDEDLYAVLAKSGDAKGGVMGGVPGFQLRF